MPENPIYDTVPFNEFPCSTVFMAYADGRRPIKLGVHPNRIIKFDDALQATVQLIQDLEDQEAAEAAAAKIATSATYVHRFRVGDLVETVRNDCPPYVIAARGEVMEVDESNGLIWVQFARGGHCSGWHRSWAFKKIGQPNPNPTEPPRTAGPTSHTTSGAGGYHRGETLNLYDHESADAEMDRELAAPPAIVFIGYADGRLPQRLAVGQGDAPTIEYAIEIVVRLTLAADAAEDRLSTLDKMLEIGSRIKGSKAEPSTWRTLEDIPADVQHVQTKIGSVLRRSRTAESGWVWMTDHELPFCSRNAHGPYKRLPAPTCEEIPLDIWDPGAVDDELGIESKPEPPRTAGSTAVSAQPAPVDQEGPSAHDLVAADLAERKAFGLAKYGATLQAHNGRDTLQDLYEEVLDAACYLRTLIEEGKVRR